MMNKNHVVAVSIAAVSLIAGLILGWAFFATSVPADSRSHQHLNASETQQTWTCSMHPQVRKTEAGDCPICGMDLIPLDDSASETNHDIIEMSASARKLAQIQTTAVQIGPIERTLQLSGETRSNPELLFTQSSHIPGRIESLAVNYTGQFVERGQEIARIYSPELINAQQELIEALSMEEQQPEFALAARQKLKSWKLTDAQIDALANKKDSVESFSIYSEASGFVSKLLVRRGDYIRAEAPFFELSDLSDVWVELDIYEQDFAWISVGTKVEFSTSAFPANTYTGSIFHIDPAIDSQSRVARALAKVENPGFQLKPGMLVRSTVYGKRSDLKTGLLVPKSAVMWTGRRSLVYQVYQTDEMVGYLMREVRLGPDLGDHYVVETGLRQDDEVVINGAFSIDAAAQLLGKPSMMNIPDQTTSDHARSNVQHQRQALTPEKQRILQELLLSYLDLKNALVVGNFEEAQPKAQLLETSIKSSMDVLAAIDLSSAKQLVEQGSQMILKTNVDQLRKDFIALSEAMIGIAEQSNIPFPVYVQFCPMANNDDGARWLSTEKEIRNPYYGDMMLTCGEVEKELN